MTLIRNISDNVLEIPDGPPLNPDEYRVWSGSTLPPELAEFRKYGYLAQYVVGHVQDELWDGWLEHEYQAFLSAAPARTGMLRSNKSWPALREITTYLVEKLPQKKPTMALVGDTLGFLCLSRVAIKMWRDVIRRELEAKAKAYDIFIPHTVDGIVDMNKINIKICFIWNQQVTGVESIKWWRFTAYENWIDFLATIQPRPHALEQKVTASFKHPRKFEGAGGVI